MKKILYFIIGTFVPMMMTSCYDSLDKQPYDQYTDAVVWNDPELLDSYLAELYDCTPVMVNDATCLMNTWSGAPMDRDNTNFSYLMGNSEQMEGPVLTMEVSDETKYNMGGQFNLTSTKSWGIQSDGGIMEWWGNAYYTIRNLNDFIARGAKSTITNAAVRVAEARFLRAFCYFAMVKRYGGVPLITEVSQLNSDSTVLYPKRNSEQEVYDFVLKETDEISKILPGTADDYGRATKWAALALRSRAALYAGSIAQYGTVQLDGLLGIPSSDASKYYQICYDACKEIISGGQFSLYNSESDKVENFKNIFLKKKNCEIILAKQHTGKGFMDGGSNRWSWDMVECPRPNVWGIGNYNGVYLEMAEEFEHKDGTPGTLDQAVVESKPWTMEELWGDKDPRFAASVWTNGTGWPGATGGVLGSNTIDMHNGILSSDGTLIDGRFDSYKGVAAVGDQLTRFRELNCICSGFGVMKYLDKTANNMSWFCESTTDYQIFRYAEILLNYAEAAFELNKTADALNAINQIRSRAGIANLTTITRDKIRHERKVELAFENHRYWDLRRWRTAATELTKPNGYTGLRYIYDSTTGKYYLKFITNVDGQEGTPKFPVKNYYFPITKSRIAANHNLVENPGYE